MWNAAVAVVRPDPTCLISVFISHSHRRPQRQNQISAIPKKPRPRSVPDTSLRKAGLSHFIRNSKPSRWNTRSVCVFARTRTHTHRDKNIVLLYVWEREWLDNKYELQKVTNRHIYVPCTWHCACGDWCKTSNRHRGICHMLVSAALLICLVTKSATSWR